ncbi:MAG: hypothetical protein AAFX54_17960 [Pseudomonadota bacterium]
MTYLYETLDPETFQKLSQALIVSENPDTQCLPVAQPDGGRDAFSFLLDQPIDGLAVYQVKFSRDPKSKTERDVIESLIDTEKEKVQELISLGAKKYYLVTNVQGTAHLNAGSIDRINKKLSDEFDIPSVVWWRDDLDAKIDNSSDIRWSYPQICRATDVLGFLVEKAGATSKETSTRTIWNYLATQYSTDKDVKFKQVELTHNLTDLFVDLPIGLKGEQRDIARQREKLKNDGIDIDVKRYVSELLEIDHNNPDFQESSIHGGMAAAFFSNAPVSSRAARIVLEGAPGQGKSTVTQYICQVNRVRITNKNEYKRLPDAHKFGFARVPFRIDLRDYATWLSGKHPFSRDDKALFPGEEERSLECFLAMQISWFSAGLKISHEELLKFMEYSHCLIVLDGFDEVADVKTRSRVVEEICQASERLELHALSVQLIVTSRPAAFANSPGFPEESWVHLELKDLRNDDIENYKNKWTFAQSLSSKEQELVSATLKNKLEQPHIRQLARNPMQLSILLHLIHIQGAALPDKRTALYQKYMDLFFNREAEKSDIVRDYRDLLMSIHGYLGWVLQTQAEKGEGSGSIAKENFKKLIKEYLDKEGHDQPDLADLLLEGIEERVVALVSRVKGTYEFEVQPLREYFTALYLYDSAPHSSPGGETKGTKPDRFEALAKNPYWTNVTRFYCGFYGRGELSSLVEGIIQLDEDQSRNLINQPRRLALMLLSDWVFSQSPRDIRRLVDFVAEEPGFTRLLCADDLRTRGSIGALPIRCGQKELREVAIKKRSQYKNLILGMFLRGLISQNANVDELKQYWKEETSDEDPMSRAMQLGIDMVIDNDSIKRAYGKNFQRVASWMVRKGQIKEVIHNKDMFNALLSSIFSGEYIYFARNNEDGRHFAFLDELSNYITPHSYPDLFTQGRETPAKLILQSRRFWGRTHIEATEDARQGMPWIDGAKSYAKILNDLLAIEASKWRNSLECWEALVDNGFDIAPQSSALTEIAHVASCVSQLADSCNDSDRNFWRSEKGLVRRLHFAKAQSNKIDWWSENIASADNEEDNVNMLVSIFSWASLEVITKFSRELDSLTSALDESQWLSVRKITRLIYRARNDAQRNISASILEECRYGYNPRFIQLLIPRISKLEEVRSKIRSRFKGVEVSEHTLIRDLAELEAGYSVSGTVDWEYFCQLSLQAKKYGAHINVHVHGPNRKEIPEHIARKVLTNSGSHFYTFIDACEQALSSKISKNAPLVSKISESQSWFELS